MSRFTPKEIEYLQSQRLGRMATIGANGDLHVVPLSFRYNPDYDTIDLGGRLLPYQVDLTDRTGDGHGGWLPLGVVGC